MMNKIDAVIPAAGIGRRMGGSIPKQYLKIGKYTILEHTVSKILAIPEINNIFIAVNKNDQYFSKLSFINNKKIVRVEGGSERADSVISGLKSAQSEFVLVHDAARPCVLLKDICELIKFGLTDNGAILAAKIVDTVKKQDINGCIAETIPRSGLWRALTPQLFRRELLLRAYMDAKEKKLLLTDEASAMEALGYHPFLVSSMSSNIKVTEPSDLILAKFFLGEEIS